MLSTLATSCPTPTTTTTATTTATYIAVPPHCNTIPLQYHPPQPSTAAIHRNIHLLPARATATSNNFFETAIKSYNVYTSIYLQIGFNHVLVFVETKDDTSGVVLQVTGNVREGMKYESKAAQNPSESKMHIPGSLIMFGTVKHSDMAQFKDACKAIEVPGIQLTDDMRPIDLSKPIRRCAEWVEDAKTKSQVIR